jgi:[protein-PII] uridylyltransferase
VVSVVAPDRAGLFAAVAGVLALHRFSVRTADIRTEAGMAVDEWWVDTEFGEGAPRVDALRDDVRRALDGSYDVHGRLARRDAAEPARRGSRRAEPLVTAVDGASHTATVLEVRAHSVPGLLHRLAVALHRHGAGVLGARVSTLGAEAVDVFYVVGPDGRPLVDAAPIVDALREAAR